MNEDKGNKTKEGSQHKKEDELKENNQPKIFISHCHIDSRIADVFRERLGSWTNYSLPIFQSSSVEKAPAVGGVLKDELAQELAEAEVVLFLYTSPERDWDYPIWECGVALDPKDLTKTRIIVFEFGSTSPKVFSHLTRVPVNKKGIRKFTWDFHKGPKFFPNHNKEFLPDVPDHEITTRSNQLFTELSEIVPDIGQHGKEVYRWDFIRVALAANHIEDIRTQATIEDAYNIAPKKILDHSVIREEFGQAVKHFGYNQIETDMAFGKLIKRWEEDSKGEYSRAWIDELYREMTRAITNRDAVPTWYPMKSMCAEVNCYLVPVINHVRVLLKDNCTEFDLYFYRVSVDEEGRVLIGASQE